MNDDARLEGVAKRLGSAAAERLDMVAVTGKVLAELRRTPRRRSWIEMHWLRIAAAIVILVGGGIVVRQLVPDTGAGDHANHFIADDLDELTTEQLRSVLAQFDELVGNGSVVSDSSDLRELDAQQLRAVLRSLEG